MKPVHVTEHVIDVIAANGVPFRAVYGKRTNNRGYNASYPTIAFYDRRHAHDTHGQFIGDYMSDNILSHGPYALNLDGGVNAWTVDRWSVQLISDWLRTILGH
jgi:hypothetical protein